MVSDIKLADRINDRVLLADKCGFDSCTIRCREFREATIMLLMARMTGFDGHMGESEGEYWVVLSWA